MKRTIILLLVAVLSVATMSAQKIKKPVYVIDGHQVENFDGSQLNGKTIVKYSIEPVSNIHVIVTSDYKIKGRTISDVKTVTTVTKVDVDSITVNTTQSTSVDKKEDVLCVIHGNIVPYSEMKKTPSSKIDSVTIIKDKGTATYVKYAKEAGREPKCIIKVVTK